MKKIISLVVCISLLFSASAPAFANSNEDLGTRFLAAHQQLSVDGHAIYAMASGATNGPKLDTTDIIVLTTLITGSVLGMATLPAIDAITKFRANLYWKLQENSWNRLAVRLNEIGFPKELEYFASVFESLSMPADNNWIASGISKRIPGISDEQALQIAKDYAETHNSLNMLLSDIQRATTTTKFPYDTPSPFTSAKQTINQAAKTMEKVKNFKRTYPQLTYVTEPLKHFQPDNSWFRSPFWPKELTVQLFNPAEITAAQRELVQTRLPKKVASLLNKEEKQLIKEMGLAPRSATRNSILRRVRGLGRGAGIMAVLLFVGVGVANAQEAQQLDNDMSQRMIDNPMIALQMAQDTPQAQEDVDFILQNANQLPKTIETYETIAASVHGFVTALSQQEQREVLETIDLQLKTTPATRHHRSATSHTSTLAR